MPQTTTARNACDVQVYLADETGVLHDISGSASSLEPEFSQGIGEYQVFGTDWMQRMACTRDAKATLNIVYSMAADEGLDLLRRWFFDYPGTTRRLRFDVPSSAVGNHRYEGNFLLETWSPPLDPTEAGPIAVSMDLVQTGGVTFDTIAS